MKLIDSNILIYAARPEHSALKELLKEPNIAVSNISRLEVLGYHQITEEQTLFFNAIFAIVKVFDIDTSVINKAIEIRRNKNMKVGDAIIASTAILNNCELVTRNVRDFNHLSLITLTNPLP